MENCGVIHQSRLVKWGGGRVWTNVDNHGREGGGRLSTGRPQIIFLHFKDTPPVHKWPDRIAHKRLKRKIFCVFRTFSCDTIWMSMNKGWCLQKERCWTRGRPKSHFLLQKVRLFGWMNSSSIGNIHKQIS